MKIATAPPFLAAVRMTAEDHSVERWSETERAKKSSLFFDGLRNPKVREFNPRYAEAEAALPGKFRHLHSDIYGNREFVELRRSGFPTH